MIHIIEGRDLIYEVMDYDLVLIGTSINNTLGNGFQYKVGLSFPDVYHASKTASKYGDAKKLGKVDVVVGEPSFALCYITKGRFRPDIQPDALDYEALEKSLRIIEKNYPDKKIATTIMGHSPYEGGGDREKILEIFVKVFIHSDVYLYDYQQEDFRIEKILQWRKIEESVGTDDFEQLKKEYFWEWNFGIYKPLPQEITLAEIKKLVREQKETRKNIASFK